MATIPGDLPRGISAKYLVYWLRRTESTGESTAERKLGGIEYLCDQPEQSGGWHHMEDALEKIFQELLAHAAVRKKLSKRVTAMDADLDSRHRVRTGRLMPHPAEMRNKHDGQKKLERENNLRRRKRLRLDAIFVPPKQPPQRFSCRFRRCWE
jgi:hypothetical protein